MAASSSATHSETYLDALQREVLVKLIIGPKPGTTLFVPRSQVIHCWGGTLAAQLHSVERQGSVETIKASALPTSTKGGKGAKIIQPLTSIKKEGKQAITSQDPEVLEIELPNYNAEIWAAFLFWSADPQSRLPQDIRIEDSKLVGCWNWARKYGFDEFADAAMLCLISGYDERERGQENGMPLTNQAVRDSYCFGDPAGSEMQLLLCEELVKNKNHE